MTHDDLISVAAKWLRRKHALVITELASYAFEIPDALGINTAGVSTLVECKASRADFLADAKKVFRREPERGIGTYRYYLCPDGMIGVAEIPEKWGLLYARGSRVYTVKKSEHQDKQYSAEMDCMLSAIRRIGVDPPQGVSVKFYTIQTQCRASMYLRIE